MLIVIALVSLAVAITVGALHGFFEDHDMVILNGILVAIFSSIFVVVVVVSFMFGGHISTSSCIDEQIEMYEDENAQIEQDVSSIINEYCRYEKETMSSVSDKTNTESSIILIAAYPELYSSELVKKQIEIYQGNREQIKELKAEKIELKVYRWWLYFGN